MRGMEKNGYDKIDLLILNTILILCILFVLSWPCFWYYSYISDGLTGATIWFFCSCVFTGSHVVLYRYLKKNINLFSKNTDGGYIWQMLFIYLLIFGL